METYEIRCKNCGKKLLKYSKSSFRKYKSPVKICKKCGTRYADPRCHEIAIEGIPSDTLSIRPYVILIIIGALIFYRGIYLYGMHPLGTPNVTPWLLPSVFVIFGMILAISGIVEIFTIISGIKAKKFEALRKASDDRLNDKNYILILQDLGYKIPEKYS